jgi:two-component system repressor protein LuxO
VRQLQNIVRGIVVLHDGQIITSAMLPAELKGDSDNVGASPSGTPQKDKGIAVGPLWQVERAAIESAISLCEGNIPRAAAMLEISPSTIYRKKMLWDKDPSIVSSSTANAQFSGLDRPSFHS